MIDANISSKSISADLLAIKDLFEKAGFEFSELKKENESQEYSAYRFQLNKKDICYREAKITPTKTGQFVTLWKRNKDGIIAPFDNSDTIDYVIISVRKNNNWGQFIFPKKILAEKRIFLTPDKEGIRATRVYPPWDETTSKQAKKTQEWQLHYFYAIAPSSDLSKLKNLFL